jgi:hypothetical protein
LITSDRSSQQESGLVHRAGRRDCGDQSLDCR